MRWSESTRVSFREISQLDVATEETGLLPLLQARRQALEREKRILSARIAGLNRQVTTTPAGNARWRLFGSSEQLRGVCELLLEAATSQGEAAAQRQEDLAQLAQDNGELVSQLRAEEAKTAFLLEKVGERGGGDGELAEFLRRQLEVVRGEKALLRLRGEVGEDAAEGVLGRGARVLEGREDLQGDEAGEDREKSLEENEKVDHGNEKVNGNEKAVDNSDRLVNKNDKVINKNDKVINNNKPVNGNEKVVNNNDKPINNNDKPTNTSTESKHEDTQHSLNDTPSSTSHEPKPHQTAAEKPWRAARRIVKGSRTPQRLPKPPITIGNYAVLEKKRSIVTYKPKLQDTSISMEDLQLPALPAVLQEEMERGSRKRTEEDTAIPLETPKTKVPKGETEVLSPEEPKVEVRCRCKGKCANRKCPCRSNGKKCSASCACLAGRCVNRRSSTSSTNETTATESSLVV